MSLMPRPSCERDVLVVAVVHGCTSTFDRETHLPAGHCLSRARSRHLLESDWVILTNESVPVGLAAYKPAHSDVRVVHELLVDMKALRYHARQPPGKIQVVPSLTAYASVVASRIRDPRRPGPQPASPSGRLFGLDRNLKSTSSIEAG